MQITVSPRTTEMVGERTGIVGFLGVDITKGWLPGAVSKTDGVADPPISCKADKEQIVSNSSTADGGERTGIVGFLGVDITKGWLPGAISKANGVPEPSIP